MHGGGIFLYVGLGVGLGGGKCTVGYFCKYRESSSYAASSYANFYLCDFSKGSQNILLMRNLFRRSSTYADFTYANFA